MTISGTRFTEATAVQFGSKNAPSFTVKSSNEITVVVPAGEGEVDVIVSNSAGASPTNASDKFTYLRPKAERASAHFTGVIPAEGPTTGGTVVTISGTNLTGATAVQFGSTGAASFAVKSSTEISAVSPPGRPETVHLKVTTAGSTSPRHVGGELHVRRTASVEKSGRAWFLLPREPDLQLYTRMSFTTSP